MCGDVQHDTTDVLALQPYLLRLQWCGGSCAGQRERPSSIVVHERAFGAEDQCAALCRHGPVPVLQFLQRFSCDVVGLQSALLWMFGCSGAIASHDTDWWHIRSILVH